MGRTRSFNQPKFMATVSDETNKEVARLTDDYENRIDGRVEKRLLDLSRKNPGKNYTATTYQWKITKWVTLKSSTSTLIKGTV